MKINEPRGWIKGQSGHPKGRRTRAKTWTDLLRRIGREQVRFEDDGEITLLSREERLARTLWTRALDGDLKAAQMLLAGVKAPASAVAATMTLTLEDLAAGGRRIRAGETQANADADSVDANEDDVDPLAG